LVAEHELGVHPGGASLKPFGGLSGLMTAEGSNGLVSKGDLAAGSCSLWLGNRDALRPNGQGSNHPGDRTVEVKLRPFAREERSLAHAGGYGKNPKGSGRSSAAASNRRVTCSADGVGL